MGTDVRVEEILSKTRALMPGVTEKLKNLIRYPSVAFPGSSPKPVTAMADATAALLKEYGLPSVRLIDIPGGYPAVYGECPAPPGMPTADRHDVRPLRCPAGPKRGRVGRPIPGLPWKKDGRIYGRGAADDKSGIVTIAASLAVFDGKPPVGVKVLIEGEEETTSHLDAFVTAHPDFFRCDAFVIADMGNLSVGDPALTTSLRGEVSCIVEVRTLESPVHSGTFGGAAPDALVALVRMLATLHDAKGDVAVPGLRTYSHGNPEYPAELYRESAGLLKGVDLIGTGSLGARLWSKPSVTVIGIDAPSIGSSANILIPKAAVKISMRIAPDADPRRELQILMDHLRAVAPWNVHVDMREVSTSSGFICPSGGPAFSAASRALETAFKKPVLDKGDRRVDPPAAPASGRRARRGVYPVGSRGRILFAHPRDQ
jgi:acetylornithine deacetylase/succinyl-diaminopimelate desuccinylase-like protein